MVETPQEMNKILTSYYLFAQYQIQMTAVLLLNSLVPAFTVYGVSVAAVIISQSVNQSKFFQWPVEVNSCCKDHW
jgi:uncharacterized protein involved in cysteine biosynthesis